jgi:hypothetical protein
MPYYKDTANTDPNLNGLHRLDNPDHEHLLPATCVLITDDEAAQIESAFEAAQAAKSVLLPNPAAFIQACKTAIGLTNIQTNQLLFATVQLAIDAMQQNQMADVQTIIVGAQTNNIITASQYTAIKTAAAQFNIPITLP